MIYGRDYEALSVAVDAHDLYVALHTEAGVNAIINLEIDGGERVTTLAREIKRHPWKGTIDHVDFIKVSLTETVVAEVAVHFEGTAIGVSRDGGILETIKNTVEVEALPRNIPTAIPLDVSGLAVGDGARVLDLPVIAGVQYLDDPDSLLVTVSLPAAEVAAEEEELPADELLAEVPEGEEEAETAGEPQGEADSE